MYQINRDLVAKVLNFILIFSIVIALLGAVRDFRNIAHGSAVDLRNRVVGARLLTRDLDPYFYKWQPGDPETLLDPYLDPAAPVSSTTLPPTGLALYIPFADLSYSVQKFIWLALQWIALLASLVLLIGDKLRSERGKFLLIVALLFFGGGRWWRAHVSLGQVYIFYTFFLAIAYRLLHQKSKWSDAAAGLFVGLTASIRFPFLVMVLPMLLLKRFKLFVATLISFLACLAASMLAFGREPWLSYFSAMSTIAGLFTGPASTSEVQAPSSSTSVVYPKTVEGVTWEIIPTAPGETTPVDTSIPLLLNELLQVHISTSYLIGGIGIALLLYSFVIFRLYKQNRSQFQWLAADEIFIFGSLMVTIAELLIPVPRYPYYNVQLLIPLVLILKNANFSDFYTLCLTFLLFFGFLLSNRMFDWLPVGAVMGQFLLIFALIGLSLIRPTVPEA